jgi:hypothetical protein
MRVLPLSGTLLMLLLHTITTASKKRKRVNHGIKSGSFSIIVGQNPSLQKLSISVSYVTDDRQKITKKEFN